MLQLRHKLPHMSWYYILGLPYLQFTYRVANCVDSCRHLLKLRPELSHLFSFFDLHDLQLRSVHTDIRSVWLVQHRHQLLCIRPAVSGLSFKLQDLFIVINLHLVPAIILPIYYERHLHTVHRRRL